MSDIVVIECRKKYVGVTKQIGRVGVRAVSVASRIE